MAIELATGYVNIVPSTRGFRKDLTNEAAAAGDEAGNAASSNFGSGFQRGSALSTAIKAVTVGLAAIGTAAVGYGVKIASQNEQAQVSFETMLGSADKAQVFLTQLREFAANTPFEFPELQTAASSLISIGISADKVIPIMTSLGDATSGVGTGSEGVKRATVALQQMNAAGKISAEDLNQLRDAGIPVFELLTAATGKTKEQLAEMAQNGKLGRQELEQLMAALESGKGLDRFNGLMEKQSQTLAGLMSTLKDVAGQGLAAALQPAVGVLKGIMPLITNSLVPVLGALGKIVASALGPLMKLIIRLSPMIERFANAFGDILGSALDALLPVVIELFDAFAPYWNEFIDIARKVLPPLARAFAALLSVIAPLIRPILRLATILLERIGAPILEKIADAVVVLADGIATIADAIGAVLDAGVDVLAQWLDTLFSDPGAAWDAVVTFFTNLPGLVSDALSTLGSWIWTNALQPAATYIGDHMGEWLSTVAGFFRALPERIRQVVGDLGAWLNANVFTPAREAIIANMPGWADSIGAQLKDLPNKMAAYIETEKKLGNWLWDNVFTPAKDYLVAQAPGWLDSVSQAFKNAPTSMVDQMEHKADAAQSLGGQMWDRILRPAADQMVARYGEWMGLVESQWRYLPRDLVDFIAANFDLGGYMWNRLFVPAATTLALHAPEWAMNIAQEFSRELDTFFQVYLRPVLKNIVQAFANLPGDILLALKTLAPGIWGTFVSALSMVLVGLPNLLNAIVSLFGTIFIGVLTILGGLFVGIWNNIFAPGMRWVADRIRENIWIMAAAFGSLGGAIVDNTKGAFNGLVDALIDALNQIIDIWNNFTLSIGPTNVLGVDVGPFSLDTPDLPHITRRARGGKLAANMPAIVGEQGPELWWPNAAGKILPNAATNAALAPATGGLTIGTIEVRGQDQPEATAFEIRRAMRKVAFFAGATY